MRIATVVTSVLLSTVLLAACSRESQPTDPIEEGRARPQVAPGSTPPSSQRAGGTGLTGKVSSLNSAVSGLSIRVTDYGTVIDLPADALFKFDRADLTSGATMQLTKSAQVIAKAPAGVIRVVGHTDSKGEDAYNQRLSQARAETVAKWFRQQPGVRQRVFEVEGRGETQPVAPNQTASGQDDPAGRAKNRRVEVLPKA